MSKKSEIKKPDTKKAAVKNMEIKAAVQKPLKTVKPDSRKFLVKTPEAMVFWCHDGQLFDDLEKLMNGFDLMSDETFMYHANPDKNDFSCWLVDVIGDLDLANDLRKARNKDEAGKITRMRYEELTRLEG
jgi:hypothetical protein